MSEIKSAFYQHFDRHAHGKGLKGASTHYCPGCGHGLAHKYLAEAIDELDIADRTIMISPVGCSVFLYYYFDTGNSQAAHGRAPAVGLGHKLANPNSIIVSYQGDGDLASIGIAEIMFAAQLGVPITVVFINNAIYGMTGGQMAPTTLLGQKSTTSPYGRSRYEGLPSKMAETIATFDAPIYVERVALFDQKTRKKAKKAITKGLQLQMEARGFSFIEVLAECPTHLKLSPLETIEWVKENMVPMYPLGVYKDESPEPWFKPEKPSFDSKVLLETIEASEVTPERFCKAFPTHLHPNDVSLKLAGSGGDGAQTAAMMIAKGAINEGFDATHIPSYGPESRGGTSYADVHVAAEEVLSPGAPEPKILLAFNAPSLHKFGPLVAENGIIIYDPGVTTDTPDVKAGVTMHPVPMTEIALSLGKAVVKNVVALGALQAVTDLLTEETFLQTIRIALQSKCAMIPVNEEAFRWGVKAVKENITSFAE